MAPKIERELFRIGQEALNNVLHHAQASHTTIALDMSDRRVTLTVRDDGCGFDRAVGTRRTIPEARESEKRLVGQVNVDRKSVV